MIITQSAILQQFSVLFSTRVAEGPSIALRMVPHLPLEKKVSLKLERSSSFQRKPTLQKNH